MGDKVAKSLGGGASFSNGTFTGLDDNIKNINNRIKEVSEGVAQDSLLWSTKDQAFVAKYGEKQENRKITSLSVGAITKSSTDAVTGR